MGIWWSLDQSEGQSESVITVGTKWSGEYSVDTEWNWDNSLQDTVQMRLHLVSNIVQNVCTIKQSLQFSTDHNVHTL